MTITAVLALLVAIPLVLRHKKLQITMVSTKGQSTQVDDNQRYDIEDFLT